MHARSYQLIYERDKAHDLVCIEGGEALVQKHAETIGEMTVLKAGHRMEAVGGGARRLSDSPLVRRANAVNPRPCGGALLPMSPRAPAIPTPRKLPEGR